MHAVLVDLLPWLAAFLVLDGLVEVRRGHLLLRSSGGPLRAERPGLRLLPPWPLVEAVPVQDLPWLATAGALHLVAPGRRADLPVVEPSDLSVVPWEGLAPRAEGRKVTSGGHLLVATPHPAAARALAEKLAAAASAGGAPSAAARQAAGRDHDAARALRRRQAPWLLPLRIAASGLSGGLFLGGGLLALGATGGALGAGQLLLALGALLAAELGLALGMLRACGVGLGAAVGRTLALAAWPVAALRPLPALSGPLYAALDGLAVAAALLPADAFRALAAGELGRLDVSRRACGPALEAAWAGREEAIEELLSRVGGSLEEARRAPPRLPGEAAWCPVCRTGFVLGPARCADCGAGLLPFGGARPG